MNSTRNSTLAGIALLLIGLGAGWWWGQRAALSNPEALTTTTMEEPAILYWYDPMMPQHHFDQPGKSPFMDMQLVPRYANEGDTGNGNGNGNGSEASVSINSQLAQNIGLREAVVERIALESVVEATGLLTFNERDVAIEQVRSAGLVERVWPLAPGDVIAAGQPLAELLVPAWSAAQAEFIALRASFDSTLVAAARERLRIIGLSTAQIEALENSGRAQSSFIVRASRAGVLQTLDVRSGMKLDAGQTLAQIQGIETLWLEVAVPEDRAWAVKPGEHAEARLAAYPEQVLRGKIIAVLPELTTSSRTLRVRIELPNTHHQLLAGMSAQVRLAARTGEEVLAVPTEAIIRTGKRALVMLLRDEGRFVPTEIALGPEIDNRTVVSSGLEEGQRIVSSAQFLLDSEANLSSAFAPPAAAQYAHPTAGESQ